MLLPTLSSSQGIKIQAFRWCPQLTNKTTNSLYGLFSRKNNTDELVTNSLQKSNMYNHVRHFQCMQNSFYVAALNSGSTSGSGRRTFPVLHSTCGCQVTIYVCKPSAIGQPTRPTQPFIPSGSIGE